MPVGILVVESTVTNIYRWSDLGEISSDVLLLDALFRRAPLAPSAINLFAAFNTTNFELVMERLIHADQVAGAFTFPPGSRSRISGEYAAIRDALFAAVRATHIAHMELPEATLQVHADCLLKHPAVYTTNYDLLPYWALMSTGADTRFMDFFRRNGATDLTFAPDMTDWWPERTRVYYLHGGLHLWRDDWSGTTGKWEGLGLLDLDGRYQAASSRLPLLVSEGSPRHKYAAIQNSRYLSFALEELSRDQRNLVIFGSSLGSSDAHIVDAIGRHERGRIVISLRTTGRTRAQISLGAADLVARFDGKADQVLVFDAATHPLGQPELFVR